MSGHDLTVTPGGGGTCACGDTFDGASDDVVDQWRDHVDLTVMLIEVREAALRERAERARVEEIIRHLLDLGLPTQFVSDAIGSDPDGRPMISASVVQRVGRDNYARNPRRRRR